MCGRDDPRRVACMPEGKPVVLSSVAPTSRLAGPAARDLVEWVPDRPSAGQEPSGSGGFSVDWQLPVASGDRP